MKLSDVVSTILYESGVTHVFGVSGGACLHLIDSVIRNPNLNFVATHHEQNAGMAADSLSRSGVSLGCSIVTSGPGATNLITAISGCYFDSIPCIFITGQVSTSRQKRNLGVRQIGFQETPIVDMVKPITKAVLSITSENYKSIGSLMRELINIANDGRPGPVLMDIPDDLQRVEVDPSFYLGEELVGKSYISNLDLTEKVEEFRSLLLRARKPILVLGNGINVSNSREKFTEFSSKTNWPILNTWSVKDLVPWSQWNNLGTFGTHGLRASNLIIQNSDLVVAIGSRLDTKSTGSPISTFAPRAKKIIFDIDEAELNKFFQWGLNFDLKVKIDLKNNDIDIFLQEILKFRASERWTESILTVKNLLIENRNQKPSIGINAYEFIEELSEQAAENSRIFVDTGCAIAWTMQSWQNKRGQRIFHDFNNTAMGWSIPASFAYSLVAKDEESIITLCGDGSFMMSLQEILSFKKSVVPIKFFLLNNSGYSMIKQTQEQWFKSRYFASSSESDLIFPDFEQLVNSFGIKYLQISETEMMHDAILEVLSSKDSVVCEVNVGADQRVIPQTKFGNTLEFMDPEYDVKTFQFAKQILDDV